MPETLYEPDWLLQGSRFASGHALAVAADGMVRGIVKCNDGQTLRLKGRALLPGLVNAHSHAFQRLIRGRTEFKAGSSNTDDFWSWREQMYRVASVLQPEDVFVASRQAFLEMCLAGITSVGEFHYLHHSPTGTPYVNYNELSEQVIRAAREIGMRITLLRVAYARPGYALEPNANQRRFVDRSVDDYRRAVEELRRTFRDDHLTSFGLAPHSVRAVPKSWLEELASQREFPLHMHVAEQLGEVNACIQEYGRRPVEFLDEVGILARGFTAVHAIHLTDSEVMTLASHGACACACPTTERNLGDGIFQADRLQERKIPIALGSDSQATIDLLHEARLVEENLRLQRMRRVVLASDAKTPEDFWGSLFTMATSTGANSLGIKTGVLEPGSPADFFTVDLEHPSLAGADQSNLLAAIIFGADKSAIRDVAVQGHFIVRDGRHRLQVESGRAFANLAHRIFA